MLTAWTNACYYWVYKIACGRNSVVECRLPKPNAVGSNPIARFVRRFSFFIKERKKENERKRTIT